MSSFLNGLENVGKGVGNFAKKVAAAEIPQAPKVDTNIAAPQTKTQKFLGGVQKIISPKQFGKTPYSLAKQEQTATIS